MLFRGKITHKRGAVLGNRAVFFLGGAVFDGRLHKSAVLFAMKNYIKSLNAAGGGGGFLPWVGRFLLGDSTKALCFFDVELYKIMECWRGMGRFFVLRGQVFAGK